MVLAKHNISDKADSLCLPPTKKKKSLFLEVPKLFLENYPKHPYYQQYFDRAKSITSWLTHKERYTHQNKNFANWWTVHHKYVWEDMAGHGYREVINILLWVGVIEVYTNPHGRESYSYGNFCKKYRLSKEYRQSTPVLTEIENNTCKRRMYRFFNKLKQRKKKLKDGYKYCDENMQYFSLELPENVKPEDLTSNDTSINIIKHTIKNGFEINSPPDKRGRQYNTATKLTRTSRPYIYITNKTTGNKSHASHNDYKSSQPTITGVISKKILDNPSELISAIKSVRRIHPKHIGEKSKKYKSLSLSQSFTNSLLSIYPQLTPLTNYFSYLMREELTHDVIPQEVMTCIASQMKYVEKWLELCRSGQFYQYFMDKMGITDKDTFKKDYFFRALYGPTYYSEKEKLNTPGIEKMWQIIKSDFPPIAYILEWQKHNYGGEFKAHSKSALLMQRIEADIMYNGVVKTMKAKYENVAICPIHDCLMCEPQYTELVADVMKQEFYGRFGVEIGVDTTNYE